MFAPYSQQPFYVRTTYWVTQKLPQICIVILRILSGKFAWFAVTSGSPSRSYKDPWKDSTRRSFRLIIGGKKLDTNSDSPCSGWDLVNLFWLFISGLFFARYYTVRKINDFSLSTHSPRQCVYCPYTDRHSVSILCMLDRNVVFIFIFVCFFLLLSLSLYP